jgi:general secretion pathway protein D
VPIRRAVVAALLALLSSGCGQHPIKPAATHISAPEPAATGTVPPVQLAPVLPEPKPSARPETYSVVVNNVRLQDLLFALARDAKLNIDIHPDVSGTVTLNAVDQTLMQLLARIARQADIRYEMVGQNLIVMRDTPFLRAYRVDYVSAERRVEMRSDLSTQFTPAGSVGGAAGGAGVSSGTTGSVAKVEIKSTNRLWDTIVENVKEILQETDKILPAGAASPAAPPAQPQAPGTGTQPAAAPQANVAFREAASVIANRESGTLFVRATSRQHEKIQEFLDQVMSSVKQQVLIEVTVAEVALNDEFQRGIDWQRLRGGATAAGTAGFGTGNTGFDFIQSSANTPANVNTGAFVVGYSRTANNFSSALRLLESFGTVRVLSSPKLSVLNNQTALLRVTRDLVYFTLTPQQVNVTAPGGGGSIVIQPTFTSTPNVAAEGFMMGVLPQIGEADSVVLNVRPTIRRKIRDASDPNPALTQPNLIPEFETREFESILRIQSGQIAVLGGLMQDEVQNVEDRVPLVSDIPLLGWLFTQRKDITRKIELVIFLRPTVVKDASVDGDFARFRHLIPEDDFFLRPDAKRRDLRAVPRERTQPSPDRAAPPASAPAAPSGDGSGE